MQEYRKHSLKQTWPHSPIIKTLLFLSFHAWMLFGSLVGIVVLIVIWSGGFAEIKSRFPLGVDTWIITLVTCGFSLVGVTSSVGLLNWSNSIILIRVLQSMYLLVVSDFAILGWKVWQCIEFMQKSDNADYEIALMITYTVYEVLLYLTWMIIGLVTARLAPIIEQEDIERCPVLKNVRKY
jgi:hypothetical protein